MVKLVTIHCDVYWENEKTGRLDIEDGKLIKNEVYTKNLITHPCPNSKTLSSVLSVLQDRVICRERCDEGMLRALGVTEYDVYKILRNTHGVDFDDFVWFKFDDDPKDLCWDDVKPPNRY